jgi:hypothetical protein
LILLIIGCNKDDNPISSVSDNKLLFQKIGIVDSASGSDSLIGGSCTNDLGNINFINIDTLIIIFDYRLICNYYSLSYFYINSVPVSLYLKYLTPSINWSTIQDTIINPCNNTNNFYKAGLQVEYGDFTVVKDLNIYRK